MIPPKVVGPTLNSSSTDTFGGKSGQRALSPAPQRHLEEPRPSIQRAVTQDAVQQESARRIFTTGVFSDPPVVKNWKFGHPVITEGHNRLVLLLREEASRLYAYNNDLRSRLSCSLRDVRAIQSSNDHLRNQLRSVQDIRDQIADELAAAHESLAELDAMVDTARSKRLSRRMQISESQAGELGPVI